MGGATALVAETGGWTVALVEGGVTGDAGGALVAGVAMAVVAGAALVLTTGGTVFVGNGTVGPGTTLVLAGIANAGVSCSMVPLEGVNEAAAGTSS